MNLHRHRYRVHGRGLHSKDQIPVLKEALALWLTRGRPGQVVTDERDESIGRRAANGGLIAVLLYVFALSIVLWERHEASGCVPVGWLWFLAYSSAALAYLVPALVSLLLDFEILDRGEG